MILPLRRVVGLLRRLVWWACVLRMLLDVCSGGGGIFSSGRFVMGRLMVFRIRG